MNTNTEFTLEESTFHRCIEGLQKDDQAFLVSALEFSCANHKNQNRKSGEPYIIHPIGVAVRVLERYHDIALTAAALLHDTVEDCEGVTIEDIYSQFGDEVGFLVDSVTKQRTDFFKIPGVIIEDRIERLIWAGMKDIRVLLLKLADREHNLNTINYLKNHKQIRMASETQAVYQPLKRILGYTEGYQVQEAARAFAAYAESQGLHSAGYIKMNLMAESFENFDNDLFGLVYNDTKSIIWKITDFQTYKKICDTDKLSGIIQFLSVCGNKKWFEASFCFLGGVVIDGDIQLGISSFRG